MRTVVFIGLKKSGSCREAVRAAEKLGFYTVVFTNQMKHLSQRNEFPDVHRMIFVDLKDIKVIREKVKHLQTLGLVIDTIVSFIDPYVSTAADLCEQLCSKKISTKAINKMENKIATRRALQHTEFGIKHAIYDKQEDLGAFMEKHTFEYPVIIKSPGSTGSKDVFKAEDETELERYVTKMRKKFADTPILFEEYIEGPQYVVEVIVHNNQVHIVAVIEQEITQGERFIITGYSLLSQLHKELYDSLYNTVSSIINTLKFTNGSCHFELRRHENQWKVIEINPRISGGAINKMIEVAYGFSYVEQILKVWLGEEPSLKHKHERFVFTQYITISSKGTLQKVTGKEKALKHKGVVDVYIKPRKGAYLQRPLSMGHRYAYVMATASGKEEARKIAKAAAREIKFHLN
ncbi:biotin carboxylase [Bacillus sp. FJAT-27225]|uniref:ATP-grasp domain-containing protein n=1 Tax=Bacillus sp. FJAT-27225 TaxID=1743144 RepID=UPI00080C21FD|nr:ATP-grasp domain-containing protein [Bacillus sp. FJAT-27225]OCA84128.1 biotin carboxylase [Bacillus sp. FJAT-27225]